VPVSDDEMYRQLTEDYRHHLLWREKLFGGFLVLMGALALAFYSTHLQVAQPPMPFGWVIPLVGATLSCVFFLLDRRVRVVLIDRRAVGRAFEQRAIRRGLFDSISRLGLDAGWFPHSRVLSLLYGSSAGLLFVIFLWDAWCLGLGRFLSVLWQCMATAQ